jgi:large subunit ribosomal protein L23
MKSPSSIIKTVRLTEKSSRQSEISSKYVFEVAVHANKTEIRKAVELFFGKRVVGVNTLNQSGKQRRSRTAAAGRTVAWKKAIVTLAQGETIEIA